MRDAPVKEDLAGKKEVPMIAPSTPKRRLANRSTERLGRAVEATCHVRHSRARCPGVPTRAWSHGERRLTSRLKAIEPCCYHIKRSSQKSRPNSNAPTNAPLLDANALPVAVQIELYD